MYVYVPDSEISIFLLPSEQVCSELPNDGCCTGVLWLGTNKLHVLGENEKDKLIHEEGRGGVDDGWSGGGVINEEMSSS